MMVMASLVHRCLHISSEAWVLEQRKLAMQGNKRSYRMLEAALQKDVNMFFHWVVQAVDHPTPGVVFMGYDITKSSVGF